MELGTGYDKLSMASTKAFACGHLYGTGSAFSNPMRRINRNRRIYTRQDKLDV